MSGAPVVLVPHDPQWQERFREHAERIRRALGEEAQRIEHIGSTSVLGLAAKPIIDILLVVARSEREDTYVPALVKAGYRLHRREPEFEEHRLLKDGELSTHIHVFGSGAREAERLLLFRDLLREDPAARAKYEAVKGRLARLSWPTVNDYAEAKSDIVERLIGLARVRATAAHSTAEGSSSTGE